MSKTSTISIFFHLFFLVQTLSLTQLKEQTILLELKQNFQSPSSISSWTPSSTSNASHCSTWTGIICNKNHSVISIQLSNQGVTGTISTVIGNLTYLEVLNLSQNNLTGEIPVTLYHLANLRYLNLARNNLRGTVPNSQFLLRNLTHLYLNNNNLSGEIPMSLRFLGLVEVDLSSNALTGTIPLWFNELRDLKYVSLSTNKLNGTIPNSIGLYAKLETFDVSKNQLIGRLPEHLCAGGVLVRIAAYINELSGEIPRSLTKCGSLSNFIIYNNSFTGEVPNELWTLKNLTSIGLSDNRFYGELPKRMCLSLRRLRIAGNGFYGRIPSELSFSKELAIFDGNRNKFTGEIPVDITMLEGLMTLALMENMLSGEIPRDIVSWKSLMYLNLSGNWISGEIPREIGFLPELLGLDLSVNKLSGEIPSELGHLKLSYLNLSSNQLKGNIPAELDKLDFSSSFLNNSYLCAESPYLKLVSCNTDSGTISSSLLAVIIAAVTVFFLIVVFFVALVLRGRGRKKHEGDISAWKLTAFQAIQFDVSYILSNLDESNVIGSGSSGKVYHIFIGRTETSVAVKKIWNKGELNQELEKEFESEIKILGTIRHSNIVKLLCCISNENSKLLVYEFMMNFSLDRWLHGNSRISLINSHGEHHIVLDWPTRLHIAIGAAQGLAYLHHDCSPLIIHRDIKSSNILLGSRFEARIADFGLAKMLVTLGDPDTVSIIAGSFGYIAPEYAHTTQVNEKVDVYSFGVVLLELATGRAAQNGDEDICLADWVWRRFQIEDSILDILDNEVKERRYMHEMSEVLRLGLLCTSALPSDRPSMKEVLNILLACHHV